MKKLVLMMVLAIFNLGATEEEDREYCIKYKEQLGDEIICINNKAASIKSGDSTLYIWDVTDKSKAPILKYSCKKHKKPIQLIKSCYDKTKEKVITESNDCICMWDMKSGKWTLYRLKNFWKLVDDSKALVEKICC